MPNPVSQAMRTLALKLLTRMVFPRSSQSWLTGLPRTSYNYRQAVGDGMGTSVVMAPINWIARTFPEAPLMLERADRDSNLERVMQHAFLNLLHRPNMAYSGRLLWMATILSYFIDGNAYWHKVKSRAGLPVQLWYVPHWTMDPKWPDDGSEYITHYEYNPGGVSAKRNIDVADVVHFRNGIDPYNTRKGLSPLKALFREIFSDIEAENYTASMLRNYGIPGAVIAPASDQSLVSEEELRATKAYVQQNFTGDHRGEPLVLSGPTNVSQFGFSPEQMNVRELRKVPEERVSAIFGIAAIICGFGAGLDRSTFANYAEAREAAYEGNIIPTQGLFADELSTQLLPDFERQPDLFRVSFDISGVRILQEDETQKLTRLDTAVRSGWLKVKTAQQMMGWEVDDTQDFYLRPVSAVETPSGPPDVDGDEDEPPGFLTDDGEPTRSLKATRLQTRIMRALARDERRLQRVFADELQKTFHDLGRLMADAFIQSPVRMAAAVNGGNAKQDIDPSDEVIVNSMLAGVDFDDWRESNLGAVYIGHYQRTATATFATLNQVMNLAVNLPDPVARSIVDTGGRRLGLQDIRRDTRTALFHALAQGRSLGEGPPDLARRIQDLVPAGRFTRAGAGHRAMVIARTETKFAQNVSSLAAYGQMDVVAGVQAFDNQTGFNDADCTARNGRTFSLAEAEQETEREHPNGTLSWAPVVRR